MIAIPIFTSSQINLFDIFYYMDLTTFHLANKNPASKSFSDSNDMHMSETEKSGLILKQAWAQFQDSSWSAPLARLGLANSCLSEEGEQRIPLLTRPWWFFFSAKKSDLSAFHSDLGNSLNSSISHKWFQSHFF